MSTSKTGKHGHAKCHFVALDIFTQKKMEELVPSSHNLEVCPPRALPEAQPARQRAHRPRPSRVALGASRVPALPSPQLAQPH